MTEKQDLLPLKPCPFCGGEAALIPVAFPASIRFVVECISYACHIKTPLFGNKTEAIAAWNRRAP